MNKAQQKRFNSLYQLHVNALIRQGKAKTTVDVYSRAVRRITEFFDQCPDRLTQAQLKGKRSFSDVIDFLAKLF